LPTNPLRSSKNVPKTKKPDKAKKKKKMKDDKKGGKER
jgi:hypothetical protein